jgi:hypothetical protein
LHDAQGIGELRLLLPALGRLARSGETIVLVAPPQIPYAPAFAGSGIEPARLFVVAAEESRDRWWSAEQVLRADSVGAVLFWPGSLNDQRLRRLQLAAQDSDTLALLSAGTACAAQASPSPLRLRLAAEKAACASMCSSAAARHGPAFVAGCLGRVRCGGPASIGAWRNRRHTGGRLSSCGNPEGELQAALSGGRSVGTDLESCAGARREGEEPVSASTRSTKWGASASRTSRCNASRSADA